MEPLRVLLIMSVVSVCLGGKIEMLVKKMYGMEESMQQDIGLLRASVEDNKQALENVLDILNSSKIKTDDSEHGENEYGHLKEDVKRVKRAFIDEKMRLRETESNLKFELYKMGENISQNFNKISTILKNIEDKVGKARTKPKGPTNEDLAGMIKALAEKQDIQTNALTNISNLMEKTVLMTDSVDVSVNDKFQVLYKLLFIRTRLVDGSEINSNRGRVEVWYNGGWGTVCNDNFDDTAATVVCRSLGYSTGEFRNAIIYFGIGSGKIWLDDVSCKGGEENLFQCDSRPISSHDCSHDEDVGVLCT